MKTRIIQTRFWDDEFISEADLYTQHLYLYLLTSQYINISGMFQLSPKKIQFECKLTENQFEQAKSDLENAGKVYFKDGWVYVVNARKNNNYLGKEQNQVANDTELDRVPAEVKQYFSNPQSLVTDYQDSTEPVHIINKSKTINNKPKTIIHKEGLENDDFLEIADSLCVSLKDVQACYEEMTDWLKSKGKTYRDYKAGLRGWVRRKISDGKLKIIPSLAQSDDPLVRATRERANQ